MGGEAGIALQDAPADDHPPAAWLTIQAGALLKYGERNRGAKRRFRFRGCLIAAAVPTSEPDRLTAGDTWTWSRAFSDYPASSYTLSYAIAGPSKLTWETSYVTESGEGYVIEIPASATEELVPGTYRWAAYATDGSGGRSTAASGILTVEPDLAQFTDGEATTHNEKMLALVKAQLEIRLTGAADGGRDGIELYMIEGRQANLISTGELHVLLNKYRRAVARERNPNTANPQMLVRFVRP